MKRRWITACLVLCMLLSGLYVSALGYFNFDFPGYYGGSLRKTNYTLEKTSASSPYVQRLVTTIKTNYFLAPPNYELELATDIVTVTSWGTTPLTWKSGYGGIGTYYRLEGYPDISNGSWNTYSVDGYWSP